MSYTSLDPRVALRTEIGYTRYIDDVDRSTVSVKDNWDDYVYVPLLLPGEARTGDLPEMPFIEMTLITSPVKAMNVGADVRDQDCYLDLNLYYTDTDRITPTVWGKTVMDEVITQITESRCILPGSYFLEVINDGREYLEEQEGGKSVIFHRVIELKVKNYDKN